MLYQLKKYIPRSLLQMYHALLAVIAGAVYAHPAKEMVVIGVTGTNGKSSTVQFIAQILTELGETVGYTSTAGFSIAGKERENRMKMTMPGRFTLQRMLREMVRAGCSYAIVETSSQGLAQFRHVGINYDAVVFTNLTPEHIESHGSFDAYRKAKGLLFAHLSARPHKIINGKRIPKVSVVNLDDEHAGYFTQFPADEHVGFGWGEHHVRGVFAHEERADSEGAQVLVGDIPVYWRLPAQFARKNALAAVATVHALGFALHDVLTASQALKNVAGRFERIDCGQPFSVIVDYAYEPYALMALFASLPAHTGRVIGIHGSAGGGRDVARRPIIGDLAAKNEDIVIVTNEDPYDEDPQTIIDDVARGARAAGAKDNEQLFCIPDRTEAIRFALTTAQAGDIVLITGKGAEMIMAVAEGKVVPCDDRGTARAVLLSLGYEA